MIFIYIAGKTQIPIQIDNSNTSLLNNAVWIDLLTPSKEEENLIERHLNMELPTREEISEIEISSRLYKSNNILFMTANILAQSDSIDPKYDAVSFILTPSKLITIRYVEPQSFQLFNLQLQKITDVFQPSDFFIGLVRATIDRLADVLEAVGSRLDYYSKYIFHPHGDTSEQTLDYQQLMRSIGTNGDLNSKAHESLVSFELLITFFEQAINSRIDAEQHLQVSLISKDIRALSNHANFISNKVNFLIDATLGMINIEQNKIIKIFSVAAVIFLPPTLIASIYGMNFKFIPELDWHLGYFFAVTLMVISAWLPYKYFKYRKWL